MKQTEEIVQRFPKQVQGYQTSDGAIHHSLRLANIAQRDIDFNNALD